MEHFEWREWQRREMRLDRRHFSRIALGFLMNDILAAGLQLIAAQMIRSSGWDYSPYRITISWLLNIVTMYLIAMPITALYFRSVPKFGQVRHEQWEWKAWLVVFFIGLGMGYFGNILGIIVTNVTNAASADFEGMLEMILDGNMLLTFVSVVIGAPIVEELLFRKLLIDRTIGYGEKISVLLSGTLFGIAHGNFQQFFYAFALGCLFAYIYCKTGKIRNTIFFHMWINFSGSILSPLLLRFAQAQGVYDEAGPSLTDPKALAAMAGLIGFSAIQVLTAITGLILFFVFKHYICFYPGIREIPKGKRFLSVIVNPGMILFIGLCVYLFLP